MNSTDVVGGASGGSTTISDVDRAIVMLLTNLLGFFSVLGIFFAWLRDYVLHHALIWIYMTVHVILILFLGWLSFKGRIAPTMQKIQGTASDLNDEEKEFAKRLWCAIAANFLVVAILILATGGVVVSPFSSYGTAMIIMGQFLSEDTGARVLRGWILRRNMQLFLAGLVFYAVIIGIYELVLLGGHHFVGVGTGQVIQYDVLPARTFGVYAAVLLTIAIILFVGSITTSPVRQQQKRLDKPGEKTDG